MPYQLDDTIVAVASPPGGAARGIVRVAGPDVDRLLGSCFQPEGEEGFATPARPTCVPGQMRLDAVAATLPCRVYCWPEGRSYTGGRVAEIHTFGSPPLLEAAVRTLCRAGARLAEPGEFTLRAFLAGRIDLTRAEAVLGVVDATGREQLDVALQQLAGGLSGPLNRLRGDLLDLLADLEAAFDFADEDLEFVAAEEVRRRLTAAAADVAAVGSQLASRAEASDEVGVVLIGAPNSGKSSLFNALVGRAGALVSSVPGTTRDYLVAELPLDGFRCRLIDTAGAEPEGAELGDDVSWAAQAHTAEQSLRAQVRLFCIDSTRPLTAWEREELERTAPGERVLVLTKVDQSPRTDFAGEALATSSATGEGIETLRWSIRRAVLAASGPAVGAVAGTALRCGESIRLAADSLGRALRLAEAGRGEELVAAEIRVALEALGTVVGAVHTEDVLDRIFSRFCVGK